jgi:hypothetical protein
MPMTIDWLLATQVLTPAGRSVFYDLGFDGAEACVLEMRADLMAALPRSQRVRPRELWG